ncbi:SufD family Fe-S cluster assembly protein [Pyrobaculum neutrophilum]|uniref:SufBD protein n=1 Tax=Pyrobaculum neutrophilum (strain DSM 2338 / JCM 9278 / NBRC 100436 / V24Sta) TaxID=444157 RepID=B1YDM3_PYRNV|nr:SufD family Fe-S cluster assembly protein [Pyrobaculum neutrophilum]ACB39886.1 SufBD protein [Pyrobaculum neutrophilum V24Sta]
MASRGWLEEVRERAKAALGRPAPYGPDVDVAQFGDGGGPAGEGAVAEAAGRVGVSAGAPAYYIQGDNAYFRYLSRLPGVEVYRVEEFADAHPDLAREYLWRLVPPDLDKYTAVAALRGVGGYVVRVKAGAKVREPVLACLSIVRGGLQAPHNVVVVEEGAEAVVYTGCVIAPEAVGLHAAVSEFYVLRGAKLRFIMVHSWARAAHVRPRTGVLVEEGGEYVEYYANLQEVDSLQTSPRIVLKDGARAHATSVLLGLGRAKIDVGTTAVLEGDGAAAELTTRALAADSSSVVMRALVEAYKPSRGHVECSGLLLSDGARAVTVPQLAAYHRDAALTHEASIGRLAEEEINYLMAKGFTYEEAVSILVRGFVTTDIHRYLPEQARRYVENIEKLVAERAM